MVFKNEELLATLQPKIREELLYRTPMRVTEIIRFKSAESGSFCSPVCPRCQITLEFEYQSYCNRCGQKLDWKGYGRIKPTDWKEWRRKKDSEKK